MQKKRLERDLYITSDRCLWYRKEETIVIADLHLGQESSIASQGTTIPRIQRDIIIDALSTIIERYQPRTVVIAGDLKHEFNRNRKQEFREVYQVMEFLRERTSLVVVRGNHDNYLKNITNSAGIPFYEHGLPMGDYYITHGHLDLEIDGKMIMGHEHPSLRIRDDMFATLKRPCFLHHPSGITILPAFSPLSYGRDLLSGDRFISKVLQGYNMDEFRAYLVAEDGLLDLFTVGDIREAMPDIC